MPRIKTFDRAEALDRAMELFWKKGYHATSMQDLVDGMHINRSSMYDTYGDKHALYLEALTSYKAKYGISDYYLNFESGVEGIKAFVNDYVVTLMEDKDHRGCFLLNSTTELSGDDDVHRLLEQNHNQLRKLLQALFDKAATQNEIKPKKSSAELTDLLIAGLQGMRMMALVKMQKKRISQLSQNLLEAVI